MTELPKIIDSGPIMDIAMGFAASQTLFTATQLDLFTRLSNHPATIEEIAEELSAPYRPVEMLVVGCAAAGLLEKKGDRYSNSLISETYLVRDKTTYMGGFLYFTERRMYPAFARLRTAIETNKPQTYDADKEDRMAIALRNPKAARTGTLGMHGLTIAAGYALAEAVDFTPYHKILDLGGGSGALCIPIAIKYPHIEAIIVDLPLVCQAAEEVITQYGVSNQVKTYPGDFFKGGFPEGADVVLLSQVLHDWGKEECLIILKNAIETLPQGGKIIINEWVIKDEKTGPLAAAMLSLTMLIDTESGSNYTGNEISEMLKKVGFVDTAVQPLIGPNGIVTATKP
jgi:precorrin-6B methylase 2